MSQGPTWEETPAVQTRKGFTMKDTAPKELGILAVAALFGLVAWAMSYAVLDFAGFASWLIGAIVALITAIVLWLGWREPAPGPTGPRDLSPSGKTHAASAAETAPSAAPAAAPAAAFVSSAPAAAQAAAAPAPAAAMAPDAKAPAAEAPAAKAKPAAKPAAKKAAAKPAKKAAAKAVVASDDDGPVMEGKPETLSAARAGGADDLKQIKGVGPKLEKTLNDMGFWHFDQVASWGQPEIAWVDSRLKFKGRIERDDWISQAKTLAAGGSTAFSKKVDKGGVY